MRSASAVSRSRACTPRWVSRAGSHSLRIFATQVSLVSHTLTNGNSTAWVANCYASS